MKYYSEYTLEYVGNICYTLNNIGLTQNGQPVYFNPEDYETLSEFIKEVVIKPLSLYVELESRGLVNTGRCPFTGLGISKSSPKWTWMRSRSIYLSDKGIAIMQQEDDAEYERIHGTPPPVRSENRGCAGCYIATMCYGSENAPEVIILRNFRDEVLNASAFGRFLIRVYYKYSPNVALFIEKRPYLNTIMREQIVNRIVKCIKKK